MAVSRNAIAILLLVYCLLPASNAYAAKRSYIVYMGSHSHGSDPDIQDLERATESHHELLASYIGSYDEAKDAIIYSYKRYINGFVAMLDKDQATEIEKDPNVVSVFLDKPMKLHTTHSWDFMLLEENGSIDSGSLWNKSRFGEDVIIANLDTGVWPESKSFDDIGYGRIPSKWKGACDGGPGFNCNRKLIGARYFNKGFLAANRRGEGRKTTVPSPRDYEGHGSHTLSTAAGNFVPGVEVDGLGHGTAKGGAPRARVVAYKVCWPPGCYNADILAAFDHAIHDGVDVISVSVGGPPGSYFKEGLSIGAFHAAAKGIVVVASAGNDGPGEQTVANVAPWIFTVGASTVDREFQSFVLLPNGQSLKGTSASKGLKGEATFYPLVTGKQAKHSNASAQDAELCMAGSLNPKKVKGKILACVRGSNSRVQKGVAAWQAGAHGMILCNNKDTGNEIMADAHILPASHVSYLDGLKLFAYINSTKNPMAYLSTLTNVMNTKPAPFMASFSSRGPNAVTPQIIKPDITAPGVDIIAAYSKAISPTEEAVDRRRFSYISMSGTSMSCPHVAGLVGSLKALYPDWSPAAIRSAIMTTARTRDNNNNPMVDSNFKKANPFGYGSGHIRPNKAMDPGLVYNTSTENYLDFLCAIGYNETYIKPFLGRSSSHYKCSSNASLNHFNYPSISVPQIHVGESVSLTRRLTNVGTPGTYRVSVKNPRGVRIWINPKLLRFKHVGEERRFEVTIKAEYCSGDYVFGGLTWSDGNHYVRSPIAVNTRKDLCDKA